MNALAFAAEATLLSAVACMVLLHPVLQRVLRREPSQRVAVLACCCGTAPLAFAPAGVGATARVYETVVYICIAYAYFHLFNMSETARRIRILHEVDEQGGIDETDLQRAYSEAEVVEKRIKRMVDMGSIELRANGYVLRGHVLYLAARILDGWRGVLGYRRGAR
jgi:hypothetical protein